MMIRFGSWDAIKEVWKRVRRMGEMKKRKPTSFYYQRMIVLVSLSGDKQPIYLEREDGEAWWGRPWKHPSHGTKRYSKEYWSYEPFDCEV
jgi:hypothetical protein